MCICAVLAEDENSIDVLAAVAEGNSGAIVGESEEGGDCGGLVEVVATFIDKAAAVGADVALALSTQQKHHLIRVQQRHTPFLFVSDEKVSIRIKLLLWRGSVPFPFLMWRACV